MKTYTYSQAASTSVRTGSSYPSDSTWYSSGGYSGTLYRYSVSDNGYYYDYGSWQTKTESKTFTSYYDNYRTGYYDQNGNAHWVLKAMQPQPFQAH